MRCKSRLKFDVPRSRLSWDETAHNHVTSQGDTDSTQNTSPENIIQYKLTNSWGRNGLTTSFQVSTVWCRISCSFFVMITHSCCTIAYYYHQKAHSIPYHTVNTSNLVVNPSLSSLGVHCYTQIAHENLMAQHECLLHL